MEQLDQARFVVRGRPTEVELAAVVCAVEAVAASNAESVAAQRPRVWPRTSLRSHEHQLFSTLPPGTDGGHRYVAGHSLEES